MRTLVFKILLLNFLLLNFSIAAPLNVFEGSTGQAQLLGIKVRCSHIVNGKTEFSIQDFSTASIHTTILEATGLCKGVLGATAKAQAFLDSSHTDDVIANEGSVEEALVGTDASDVATVTGDTSVGLDVFTIGLANITDLSMPIVSITPPVASPPSAPGVGMPCSEVCDCAGYPNLACRGGACTPATDGGGVCLEMGYFTNAMDGSLGTCDYCPSVGGFPVCMATPPACVGSYCSSHMDCLNGVCYNNVCTPLTGTNICTGGDNACTTAPGYGGPGSRGVDCNGAQNGWLGTGMSCIESDANATDICNCNGNDVYYNGFCRPSTGKVAPAGESFTVQKLDADGAAYRDWVWDGSSWSTSGTISGTCSNAPCGNHCDCLEGVCYNNVCTRLTGTNICTGGDAATTMLTHFFGGDGGVDCNAGQNGWVNNGMAAILCFEATWQPSVCHCAEGEVYYNGHCRSSVNKVGPDGISLTVQRKNAASTFRDYVWNGSSWSYSGSSTSCGHADGLTCEDAGGPCNTSRRCSDCMNPPTGVKPTCGLPARGTCGGTWNAACPGGCSM
jgi:hypothetical protein